MAKDGEVLAASRYTGSGGYGAEVTDQVDSARVLAEFAAGSTIVLQGLHRTWAPLAAFTRTLVAELGHPAQVNAYITPASSRGFDPHYDVHDVFVLQISGEKRWVIHEPAHELPFADEPWSQHGIAVAERAETVPAIDTVLSPATPSTSRAAGSTPPPLSAAPPCTSRSGCPRSPAPTSRASCWPMRLRDEGLRASLPLGLDLADPGQLPPLLEAAAGTIRQRLAAPDVRSIGGGSRVGSSE